MWVISIPSELDKDLREVITKANGGEYHRGDLKAGAIEALRDYVRKKRRGD